MTKNLIEEKRPKDWNGWSHEERCRAILDMINDTAKPMHPYMIEEFGDFGFGEWEKLEVMLATVFYMMKDGPSGFVNQDILSGRQLAYSQLNI